MCKTADQSDPEKLNTMRLSSIDEVFNILPKGYSLDHTYSDTWQVKCGDEVIVCCASAAEALGSFASILMK
jgi:hypothetical protein